MKFWITGLLSIIFFSACSKTGTAPVSSIETEKKVRNDSTTNPISAIILIDAGRAKALDETDKAIELYGQAIRIDSFNDAAHFELANIYMERKIPNVQKALFHLKKATNLDPSNKWYKNFYGRLLIDSGEYETGFAIFEELINDYPKEIDYQYDLAYAYEQAEEFDKALAIYTQLEETFGFDPSINYYKHKIYFAKGDIEQGVAEIEKIIDKNPEFVTYSNYLAEYFYQNGDNVSALNYAENSLAQEPNNVKVNSMVAKIAASSGNLELLESSLKNITANQVLSLDELVRAYVPFIDLAIDFPNASSTIINSAGEIITRFPDNAKPYALLGDLLSNADMGEQAMLAYEQSVNKGDAVYSVWEQLLLYQSAQSNNENLAEYSSRAQVLFPEEFLPHYLNGFANYQIGNPDKSAKSLEEALLHANQQPKVVVEIYALLGDAYHQLNDFEQSDLNYDKALLTDPDNAYVLNNYSFYLAERKQKLEKANRMAKRAMSLNPDDANTLDTYGWVLFHQGDYKKALELFKIAVEKNATSATILEHLGDAYFKVGDKENALNYWLKARQKNPTNELLSKKIRSETYIPKN